MENDKLKKALLNAMKGGGIIDIRELDIDVAEMMETMDENDKAITEMEKPFQLKVQEAEEKRELEEIQKLSGSSQHDKDKRLPHLTNLLEIEDQSFMAYYSLWKCPVYVGRKNGDPVPHILLEGSAILPNHAMFNFDE